MFKNIYYRLGFISAVFTLALLISLPKIPIVVHNRLLELDSSIGGYQINLFGGKINLDLRAIKRGLDLEGGIRVVLRADMTNIAASQRDQALESARQVISNRVNLLGVSEPYITTSKANNDYRIIVEIPGLDNVTDAVKLIGQTAQLRYMVLKPDVVWSTDKYYQYVMDPSVWVDAGITGADMKGAAVVTGQSGNIQTQGKPEIQLQFTPEGRQKFSDIAKNNINKPVALFLDQQPISAPTISPELAQGLTSDPVITGNFDFAYAKNLSIEIRAGALPVPVQVLQQSTIGATLGDRSVQQSFFAGAVGLLLVVIFLVFRYKRLGILAGVALLVYALIVLAIFKLIPVVLTLPGIAGFILSIGMATDANILVFERVKEEVLWGKPRNLAIRLGFERAWNSIRDSNISSLITSFILFQFGSGPVRGFALTLAIGIVVSLFTSIFVVKTLVEVFGLAREKEIK